MRIVGGSGWAGGLGDLIGTEVFGHLARLCQASPISVYIDIYS